MFLLSYANIYRQMMDGCKRALLHIASCTPRLAGISIIGPLRTMDDRD
ncbi:MAG: hypothetical protein WB699_02755 [Bacteroidota bacterium]